MCLEIGNKVAVIDDVIKGVVIKIVGDIIFVKDDEGMVFQFNRAELVKIHKEQSGLTKYADIHNSMLLEKKSIQKKKKTVFSKQKNEVVMEVDLHINKLVKSNWGMDNYDMLTLQVNTAKAKLEYCINKRIAKIVFIHGVGEGVLKTELQYLFNNYPVKYYDASYQKYGLGATEVYIFQNPN